MTDVVDLDSNLGGGGLPLPSTPFPCATALKKKKRPLSRIWLSDWKEPAGYQVCGLMVGEAGGRQPGTDKQNGSSHFPHFAPGTHCKVGRGEVSESERTQEEA